VSMDPPSWLYDDVSSINLCMDYNKPHVISFLNSSSYPKGQFSANQKRVFSFNQSSSQVFLFFYYITCTHWWYARERHGTFQGLLS
jgi:hypothetical protein